MTAAATPSSPLPSDTPVCSGCATVSEQVREGHPWCDVCGWYLVYDPDHSDWTSFAERKYRRRAADYERRVTASAEQVHRASAALRDRVPDGWRVSACQHGDGAIHTVDIRPPTGTIDATACLTPPDDDGGWHVRVHNRAQRIDFPLYRAGGARAASFASPGDALDAAVNALRVEIAGATTRR
ncbi:hypothetical protein EDC02_2190 [Micromonospora sp. Llam0]|uniref:hypothetical protein n=1 Tax=Micromonospora sp. Llam0 TaxID=2485143 RepID=UPI000FAB6CA3|nr:hypothetical protein [Micromonospora sp. Llam0]ROO60329.1 hypothetical protein EDC02_2190 [Micromonospora sp. Llam0]